MKLPRKLKVGYKDYDLSVQSEVKAPDGGTCFGCCSFVNQEIHIWNGVPSEQEFANTVLHEALHAVAEFMGTFPEGFQDEEKIISSLTNGLTLLMKQNPKLMQEILNVYR